MKTLSGKTLAAAGVAALFTMVAAGPLSAHDLFLKMKSYFVEAGSTVTVDVFNGTFSTTENSIDRNRVRDISVVSPRRWVHLDTTSWNPAGKQTALTVRVEEPGTYVVGASTLPRGIELSAKDFNEYLAHDGIPDILALRRKKGDLKKAARERYAKHVKAIIQAGAPRTANIGEVLGYPAEIVPLSNPYSIRAGGSLRIRALVDGKPVANQLIVAGGRTPKGVRFTERRVRTDGNGVARVPLASRGQWYVKFINLVPVTDDPAIDYESKWATLTFEIR